jgi:two-component system cell cycle sensor histidine kinase/response regulator CckA
MRNLGRFDINPKSGSSFQQEGRTFWGRLMKTILVVDDEPLVRNLLVSYITGQGYWVLDAAGRAEALALVRSYPELIHLAIIDHTLEDGNGLDLARELSIIQPNLRVLLVSGWAEQTALAGLRESEEVGFLEKPFKREALLDKIRQILGREGQAGGAGCPG